MFESLVAFVQKFETTCQRKPVSRSSAHSSTHDLCGSSLSKHVATKRSRHVTVDSKVSSATNKGSICCHLGCMMFVCYVIRSKILTKPLTKVNEVPLKQVLSEQSNCCGNEPRMLPTMLSDICLIPVIGKAFGNMSRKRSRSSDCTGCSDCKGCSTNAAREADAVLRSTVSYKL